MALSLTSSLRFLSQCLLSALLLCGYCHAKADVAHPLEPVDTSSPRATLTGFLSEMDDLFKRFRDQYWHNPSYEGHLEIAGRAGRVLRTMDLSEVAPSARIEVGYEAATLLYETLGRIELPPIAEMPDAGGRAARRSNG